MRGSWSPAAPVRRAARCSAPWCSVVAAPGLAILTAMLSARQARHTVDRSALIESADVHQNPLLARLAGQPTGLLALWQETTIRSAANVYSDVVPSRPR
jgi:hypothetical protein